MPKVRAALDTCRKRTAMSKYVPLTTDGKPYSESTIKRYLKTAKMIAGINRRSASTTNATPSSTLASKGTNSFTLRDKEGRW